MTVEKLYTPEEVAEILQVKSSTVKAWLREGNLHGIKINSNMWRVKSEDLSSFIDNKVKGA